MEWYLAIIIGIVFIIAFIICACKVCGFWSRKEEQQEDEDTIQFILNGKEQTLDDDITMNEILDQMGGDENAQH